MLIRLVVMLALFVMFGASNPAHAACTEATPQDCATETTQTGIMGILQSIKEFFTGGGDTPEPAVADSPTTESIQGAGINAGSFLSLFQWTFPPHAGACPTTSFSWAGVTYTFDAHCGLIEAHFGLLRAVMVTTFTLSALFTVLKA